MQSVWQATQQVKKQLDALPSWLGMLMAVMLILIVALLIWQLQSAWATPAVGDYLLDGRKFTDSQLGPMVQAFTKAKLTGYVVDDHRIRVPDRQMSQYLSALAESDALPRDLQSHTAAALQQNHLFESDRDRRQRFRHARERDLAQAIRNMDQVDDAMVQVDEVEQRGFQNQRIITASVAILPADLHVLDRGQIQAIRHLVAGAIAGMKPNDVHITDLRSGLVYGGPDDQNVAVPAAEEYLRVKRAVEREWTEKVTRVLSFVPTAQVAVEAEFATPRTGVDASQAVLTEAEHLAISIAVPESYLESLWRRRADSLQRSSTFRPSAGQLQAVREEMEAQIRAAILGLVPDHIDMASAVTVTTFEDFSPSARFGWESWPKWVAVVVEHKAAWVIVIAAGAIVGLATRMWRRSSPPADGTISIHSYQSSDGDVSLVPPAKNLGMDLDEGQLRATLTDLVRENPDGAAEILHRWIEKAG